VSYISLTTMMKMMKWGWHRFSRKSSRQITSMIHPTHAILMVMMKRGVCVLYKSHNYDENDEVGVAQIQPKKLTTNYIYDSSYPRHSHGYDETRGVCLI